jgi:hypothetical protein
MRATRSLVSVLNVAARVSQGHPVEIAIVSLDLAVSPLS